MKWTSSATFPVSSASFFKRNKFFPSSNVTHKRIPSCSTLFRSMQINFAIVNLGRKRRIFKVRVAKTSVLSNNKKKECKQLSFFLVLIKVFVCFGKNYVTCELNYRKMSKRKQLETQMLAIKCQCVAQWSCSTSLTSGGRNVSLVRFPQLWKTSFGTWNRRLCAIKTDFCNYKELAKEKKNRKMIISEHFASDRYF